MSPTDDVNDTTQEDELLQESHACYAYYRPEIRNLNDPLTYKEAVRKYRQQADPQMSEQMRAIRRTGNKTMHFAKPAAYRSPISRSNNKTSIVNDLGKYLGKNKNHGGHSRPRGINFPSAR